MKLGCCPIARDKLAEARFFLSRLKRSKERQPDLRFYASAAVSAARSVTFVLQTELRDHCGDHFDEWWNETKRTLSEQLSGFELVRDSRNVAHKEGNHLFRPVLKRTFSDGPIAELRIRLNPISNSSLSDASFEVRPEKEYGLTPLTDEALAGKSRDEIDAIMDAKLEILKDLGRKLEDSDAMLKTAPPLYEPVEGYEDLPFGEIVSRLDGYLRGLDAVLDAADATFGLDLPGVTPAA